LGRSTLPDQPGDALGRSEQALHGLGREHERLVRDLHDLGIIRLSWLGFELSSVSNLIQGAARERITRAIQDVDDLIRDLRQLAFVEPDRGTAHPGLEPTIRALVEAAGTRLGCVPQLSIRGDLGAIPPAVAHNLTAVLAEALRNAVAHSRASSLAVQVTVGTDQVEVSVADDGKGAPGGPVHGLGLGSMAARVRELQGTFLFSLGSGGGTVVTWRVPLPAAASATAVRSSHAT
jgi:signal transduction histidine kinase